MDSQLGVGSKFYFPLAVEYNFSDEISERVINQRENPFIFRSQNSKPYKSDEEYFNLKTENETTMIDTYEYTANILIVDDDQMNLLVAKSYLKAVHEGIFFYETANNGLEALELIRKNRTKNFYYNLILMDCNMPVMDGFQASVLIKKMEKKREIPYTPIVAVTANVGTADKNKCRKHGMEFYLAKPYMKSQLMFIMKQALCSRRYKDNFYLCD